MCRIYKLNFFPYKNLDQSKTFFTFCFWRRNALNVGTDFNVGNDGRTTSEYNDVTRKMRS